MMRRALDWFLESDELPIIAVGCVVALIFLSVIGFAMQHDNEQWQEFAKAHDCKLVMMTADQMTIAAGVSTNGEMILMPVVQSGQKCYACDDNVTHCR